MLRGASAVLLTLALGISDAVAAAPDIREYPVPSGSHPHDVAPWLSDFGANAIVRFDPKTEKFTVYPLPSRGAAVRQILGRPGEVWLPESGANKLAVIRE